MRLRRICFALLPVFLSISGAGSAGAQTVPSAYARTFSITAGGMGSAFQPDYAGGGVAAAAPNYLVGYGAYVDVHFTPWIEVEAEGRWMRFNQYLDIHQDNYLIGYEHHFDRLTFFRLTPYAKGLVGYGKMNFEYNDAHGRFTALAYGGGLDMHTGGRFTIRPIDFEYQEWPQWLNSQLRPYGFSAGVGYRFFGR
ncbi:MAG: outer membrane beta-barrel protein [Terracidiphilus sp.]